MNADLRLLEGDLREMHGAYQRGTGLELPLTWANRFSWEALWKEGVRAADVALVIAHLRRKAARQLPVRGFRFSSFIGHTEHFLEDLAEARAHARVRRPDRGRAEVLVASGREPGPAPGPARSAGEIISAERFQAELERLKGEL